MNTNRKLYEQRLRSVDHYNKEERDLEEALKVTKSTRQDIVASMIEFCPFEKDDVLARGLRLMLIHAVLSCERKGYDNNDLYYRLEVNYPSGNGGWGRDEVLVIPFSEIEQYKKVVMPS